MIHNRLTRNELDEYQIIFETAFDDMIGQAGLRLLAEVQICYQKLDIKNEMLKAINKFCSELDEKITEIEKLVQNERKNIQKIEDIKGKK